VLGFLALDLQEIAFAQRKKVADDDPALPRTIQRHLEYTEARVLGNKDLAADFDFERQQLN
jgi:hypothetical protein